MKRIFLGKFTNEKHRVKHVDGGLIRVILAM